MTPAYSIANLNKMYSTTVPLEIKTEDEIKHEDEDVEEILKVDDNDFEDFEDFEEVSIDGSCSTAEPTGKVQSSPNSSLPQFEFAKVEELLIDEQSPDDFVSADVIFMCKPCDIYFPKRHMLEAHMSSVHLTENKVTTDRYAERHARAGYTRLDDGSYSCRYCSYKAFGRTTVSTHVSRKHGPRRRAATKAAGEGRSAKANKAKRAKGASSEAQEAGDDIPVYVTKVVMSVADLMQPDPDPDPDDPDAPEMNPVKSEDVPEALIEEVVVDGQESHVRRMCEYSCPYCRFEATRRADMRAHITEKHNDSWYSSIAQQEAEREIRRQKDTYNPEDGRHYCHYCPFSAISRPTLNAHTRRKHKGYVQPYRSRKMPPVEFRCDQCDFRTIYRHKIQAHIERKHVAEPRYTCEYCGKKYKTKSDLTSHMRFQHFHQPLVCELCGKVCSNSNALHIHKKREHFKPDFECQICKRRMVSQANLDEHTQRQHTEKQHYMCDQCGKVFDQPCKLRQHAMTHTGERPNVCHICGKGFARRAVFRQHLLIHSGQRPYVCDICGKSFTQKPGLICHRKGHPGDKPPLPVVYIDSILDKYLTKS